MLLTRWIWLPAAGEMAWNRRFEGWARTKVLAIAQRLPFRPLSAGLSEPQTMTWLLLSALAGRTMTFPMSVALAFGASVAGGAWMRSIS